MQIFAIILAVAALVLFVIGTTAVGAPHAPRLACAGLACATLALLLTRGLPA